MLVLASASPRRKELLSRLVREFCVFPADIDETPSHNEPADQYVLRMAKEKARRAVSLFTEKHGEANQGVFIASDTSVVLDDHILGKPDGFESAKNMLKSLSGRTHQVMTSLCVCDGNYQNVSAVNIVTDVSFREVSDEEIVQYWETGEPKDKAGSYAIQGVGAVFVRSISGSYSAVVGLPLYETAQLLSQHGIDPLKAMSNE